MNNLSMLCVFAACLVVSQAFLAKPRYRIKKPIIPIRYCRDQFGGLVQPGQQYYDGCNTCTCGIYGRPTICTLRACPPVYPKKPIYRKKPTYPVYPKKRAYPIGY